MELALLLLVWSAAALSLGSAADTLVVASADEPGTQLVVHGLVVDASGHPLAGAEIHVYQTDATGSYTRERAMDEGHARLSGRVRTDASGRFELRTIRPGGYPKPLRLGDRERRIPAHIHLDVAAPGYAERQLQAVFIDDPLLADPYWVDWVKTQGHPVLKVRPAGAAVEADLTIVLGEARR